MQTGEQLALAAMHKEHALLVKAADKAKAAADEVMNVGSTLIDIYEELQVIIDAKDHSEANLKKLEALCVREKRAKKILKKPLLPLLDRQTDAEIERDALGREIGMWEYRASMKRG